MGRSIDRIIADRFARWGKYLRDQRATPLVVIGLRSRDNKVVVTTCEDMPDEVIAEALMEILIALREGRVDPG